MKDSVKAPSFIILMLAEKNNFVFSFSPDRTMQEIVYKLVPDLQERKSVLICVIPTAYVYISDDGVERK